MKATSVANVALLATGRVSYSYQQETDLCPTVRGTTMKTRSRRKPQLVLENGEPSAVILDIEAYREMLERLEDVEGLKILEQMRRKPLKFRRLDDFLAEYSPDA